MSENKNVFHQIIQEKIIEINSYLIIKDPLSSRNSLFNLKDCNKLEINFVKYGTSFDSLKSKEQICHFVIQLSGNISNSLKYELTFHKSGVITWSSYNIVLGFLRMTLIHIYNKKFLVPELFQHKMIICTYYKYCFNLC